MNTNIDITKEVTTERDWHVSYRQCEDDRHFVMVKRWSKPGCDFAFSRSKSDAMRQAFTNYFERFPDCIININYNRDTT